MLVPGPRRSLPSLVGPLQGPARIIGYDSQVQAESRIDIAPLSGVHGSSGAGRFEFFELNYVNARVVTRSSYLAALSTIPTATLSTTHALCLQS